MHTSNLSGRLAAPSTSARKLAPVLCAIAMAGVMAASMAHAQAVGERNGMLVDASGKTLYVFDKDATGKSQCNGACAAAWPPFLAKPEAKESGGLTIITRDDGGKQWAMAGKPLYFFAADTQPGDAKGDGQGGVWHVIASGRSKPARASSSSYSDGDSHGYGYKY